MNRSLFLSLLLFCSGALPRVARPASFGTLANFDVFNTTGEMCHGFEIELHGVRPEDVRHTFGAPNQRYGNPQVLPAPSGTLVRYASAWDATRQAFAERTLPARQPIVPTQGHACWRNGRGDYDTSGCEHFGVVLAASPTGTEMYWLVADPSTPGSLRRAVNPVGIPLPTWNVREPAAGPPVVEAVVEAEPAEASEQYGSALWVKVFVTEQEQETELEHLVSDDPLVPRDEGQTEVEWSILQSGPAGKGHNELLREAALSQGTKSVIRRYEFYEYTGAYDPETHEVQCGGDGSCEVPLPGELGNYLGSQMSAFNAGFLLETPTLTPTGSATPTPSAPVSPTASPEAGACVGDCSGDGAVTIDEVIVLVRIALGDEPLATCTRADMDRSGEITIDEIVGAVRSALLSCDPLG